LTHYPDSAFRDIEPREHLMAKTHFDTPRSYDRRIASRISSFFFLCHAYMCE